MMRKIFKLWVSLLLVLALAVSVVSPASAAGRPAAQFLSELHMAQAATTAEAKKLLTDAGFTVYDKNLNPGGTQAVYLGYKTSPNVDDAITDISAMNMKGGYNITDYQTILADSLAQYKDMMDEYRVIAKEFADNYKAGKKEAVLAHHQLNYYYVEKTVEGKTRTIYMGDYMLDFPEDNADFAEILLKGNGRVLSNIRNLLAMGAGTSDLPLPQRVAQAVGDSDVYKQTAYYEDAKLLRDSLVQVEENIARVEAAVEQLNADTSITQEEREGLMEAARLGITPEIAFKEMLYAMPYGNGTIKDYMADKLPASADVSVFYPIIASLSPAQRLLISYGQAMAVFMYDTVEADDQELQKELKELEENLTPLSVYHGVDLSLFEGSVAVTTDALRKEAEGGGSWLEALAIDTGSTGWDITLTSLIGVGGLAIAGFSAKYLYGLHTAYQNLVSQHGQLTAEVARLAPIVDALDETSEAREIAQLAFAQDDLEKVAAQKTNWTANHMGGYVLSTIGVVVGLIMIAYSVYNIVQIVNRYKPSYTEIPTKMINTVETAAGQKHVAYQVVNSYYVEEGTTKTRAGDTNGYEGMQWVSLYYTKNADAGKCLLPSADWPTSATGADGYTPVRMFGNTKECYDLNSHCNRENAEKVYLSFQTSNEQKSAHTDVPDIVGSAFNYGLLGVSGVAGIMVGMLAMNLIKRKKKEALLEGAED